MHNIGLSSRNVNRLTWQQNFLFAVSIDNNTHNASSNLSGRNGIWHWIQHRFLPKSNIIYNKYFLCLSFHSRIEYLIYILGCANCMVSISVIEGESVCVCVWVDRATQSSRLDYIDLNYGCIINFSSQIPYYRAYAGKTFICIKLHWFTYNM